MRSFPQQRTFKNLWVVSKLYVVHQNIQSEISDNIYNKYFIKPLIYDFLKAIWPTCLLKICLTSINAPTS